MINRFGTLCAIAMVLAAWAGAGLAQETAPPPAAAGGLLVSPTYVLLDSRTRSKALILSNRGVIAQTYRISIVNRRQMPDGQLVDTDKPAEGEGFAQPLVRYSPREIMLPPNKPQMVRLLLQLPSDLPDGEYRSHILFQEIPTEKPSEEATTTLGNGLAVTIRAVFGVTIPLIVRKGNLTASAALSDIRLAEDQSTLTVRVNRTGSRSLRGDINVLADGQRIGQVVGLTVFLSTPYREMAIPLSGEPKGHRITVQFAEGEETAGAASAAGTLAR